MAILDYWQQGDRLSPVGMTLTTRFTDGVIGDITTFESVAAPWTQAGVLAQALLTGMVVFPVLTTINLYSFTYKADVDGPTGEGGTISANIGTYSLQWSADGTTWHVQKTAVISYGPSFSTITGDFGGVSALYVRLRMEYVYNQTFGGHFGGGNATVFISDLRAGEPTCNPPNPPTFHAVGVIVGLDSDQLYGGTPQVLLSGS